MQRKCKGETGGRGRGRRRGGSDGWCHFQLAQDRVTVPDISRSLVKNNESSAKWLIARQHKVYRKEKKREMVEGRWRWWWGSPSYRGAENSKGARERGRLRERESDIKREAERESEQERCWGGERLKAKQRQREGWRGGYREWGWKK